MNCDHGAKRLLIFNRGDPGGDSVADTESKDIAQAYRQEKHFSSNRVIAIADCELEK
jgi:hypothetical protein